VQLTHLALVVETERVQRGEIKEVAAAIQRQITRDFAPIWGQDATIDAFIALEDVPPGYWPILVADGFGTGIIGVHLDDRRQPYALVQLNPTWSLTVSHEALEMIADPHCNRLVPGGSPLPGQGLVEFLVEVCDPCSGVQNTYTINGLIVSDFATPRYFDPIVLPDGRCSFTGALQRPREILKDGSLAWREPESGVWWQWEWIRASQPRFVSLGRLGPNSFALREAIDSQLLMPWLYEGAPAAHREVVKAQTRRDSTRAASRARAAELRLRISALADEPSPWTGPSG